MTGAPLKECHNENPPSPFTPPPRNTYKMIKIYKMRIITYKTRYTGTNIYVPVPGTILSSHGKY